MKKIFFGLALSVATIAFAQQYPNNGYGNSGYGNNGYGNGYGNNNGYNDDYYGDQDDQNYFPDDYYYNYPNDYYPQDYYQGYYNDYRNSIVNINWNGFFASVSLLPWQINEIIRLNRMYASFSAWNGFYRYNPDRWYYDRFYALQRIMGPRVFVVFQNNYYQGMSPVVYFQNYRRSYYSAPRFACMPRYRGININIYKVDRGSFRQNNPILKIANRSYATRNNEVRANNGGFRNNSGVRNTDGNNGVRPNSNQNPRNFGGIRNQGDISNNPSSSTPRGNSNPRTFSGPRNIETPRSIESPRSNPRSFETPRGNSGGFRNSSPRSESPRMQQSAPRNNGNGESRSSSMRGRFASK